MKLETQTLRIEIDPIFSSLQRNFETGSAWVPRQRTEGQPPILNFALSERKDLEQEYLDQVREGATPAEAHADMVLAYFAIKRENVERHEDSTMSLGGFPALVRRAYSKQDGVGGPQEVFHLFVNVDHGDGTFQEFSCDCRVEEQERFEPLFWAAIRSAEFIGDRAQALVAQNAFFDGALARMDALLEASEAKGSSLEHDQAAPDSAQHTGPLDPPEDGANRFLIAGFQGAFDTAESGVSVTAMSREFGFRLVARLDDPAEARSENILSEYADDGEVRFDFYVKGVYGEGGTPSGAFTMVDDRCEVSRSSLRTDGLDYRLHFSGRIEISEGWVMMRGSLGCSYEPELEAGIDVCFAFDPGAIDWSNYQFTTIAELDAAPAETVQSVYLTSSSSNEENHYEDLPERLQRFSELRELTLMHRGTKGPLLELPAETSAWTKLKRLYINGLDLATLPQGLGELSELESLSLMNCGLSAVPASVWSLPKLTSLTLDGNRLETLPPTYDAPALVSLSVEGNALKTVPAAYATSTTLKRLSLDGNALETLPDEFNHTAVEVGLSGEDKRRLLDYEYRGADGKGLVEWDDEAYFARSSGDLKAAMDTALAHPELAPYADALRFLTKRSVSLTHAGEEDYAKVGGHRFGGMPDLPSSIAYPRFPGTDYDDEPVQLAYEFLAQVNLAEIASLQTYLPRTGILYFFLTTIHDVYGGSDKSPLKVIHYDGPLEELVSGKTLHIAEDEYSEMSGDAYAAFRAEATLAPSPPELYGARSNPHLFRGPAAALKGDEEFVDSCEGEVIREAFGADGAADHAINAYGFSQNEDPEHQVAQAHRGNPEDWTILLKVASRGDFCWSDAGDLFVVVHKSDLARGDFSAAFCTIESS